jgi:hypothetical protein
VSELQSVLEKAKLRISKLETNREPFSRILFPNNHSQLSDSDEEDYRFFRQEKSTEKKRNFLIDKNPDYNSITKPTSSLGRTSKLTFEKDELASHFKNENRLILENADLKERLASKDLEIDSLAKDNDRLRADKTKIIESLKLLIICLDEIRRDTYLLVNQQSKESSRKSKNGENFNNLYLKIQDNFAKCEDMKSIIKHHSNGDAEKSYILQQERFRSGSGDRPMDIADLGSTQSQEQNMDKITRLTVENEALKQRVESLLVILQNLRKEYGIPAGQNSNLSAKETMLESQRRLKNLLEENNRLRAQLLERERKNQTVTSSLTSQAAEEIEYKDFSIKRELTNID